MITTSRNQFVGAHVTKETKAKLKELASFRCMSVSALINQAIVELLRLIRENRKVMDENV